MKQMSPALVLRRGERWCNNVRLRRFYRLTDTVTGAVIYDATLAEPGTATLDDAVDNDTRLVLANERAVQANLRRLVEALYALPDRPLVSPRR
jgi:hypothetical protein